MTCEFCRARMMPFFALNGDVTFICNKPGCPTRQPGGHR